MTIRAITCPIGQFQQYLEKLTSVDLPRTPEARADAEHIADGVRLFRTTGAFYGRQREREKDANPETSEREAESVDLFTQVENATVNKSSHNHFSRCPECGKKAVEVSQTYSLGDPPPDPASLMWRPIG